MSERKENKNWALLRGTDADPFKTDGQEFAEEPADLFEIRQKSLYNENDRARVDNNQFFEARSNPLSSKGN